MLDTLLSGALNAGQMISMVFAYLVVLLVVFPMHECAHAFTAKLLGDDTAENQGRLTLNPIAHLDLFGTIGLLLFGIGWAKPVPVNVSRCYKMKSKKAAMAITAGAGPLSNVLMSLIFLIIYKVMWYSLIGGVSAEITQEEWNVFLNDNTTYIYVLNALQLVININLYLAVFNLIPIPPFDGSRLFLAFLPTKWYFGIMKYERYIMIGILLLLWTGILSIPLQAASGAVYNGLDFITKWIDMLMGF